MKLKNLILAMAFMTMIFASCKKEVSQPLTQTATTEEHFMGGPPEPLGGEGVSDVPMDPGTGIERPTIEWNYRYPGHYPETKLIEDPVMNLYTFIQISFKIQGLIGNGNSSTLSATIMEVDCLTGAVIGPVGSSIPLTVSGPNGDVFLNHPLDPPYLAPGRCYRLDIFDNGVFLGSTNL